MTVTYTPITDEELSRIRRETAERDLTEPRIDNVSYNSRTRQLHLKLRDGVSAAIPIDLFDEFAGVAPKQIANCQIRENGASLHWDELDVQMTTIAILQIAFKFTTVSDNARRAGSSRTSAKSAAARRNGAKGGRPRKTVAA